MFDIRLENSNNIVKLAYQPKAPLVGDDLFGVFTPAETKRLVCQLTFLGVVPENKKGDLPYNVKHQLNQQLAETAKTDKESRPEFLSYRVAFFDPQNKAVAPKETVIYMVAVGDLDKIANLTEFLQEKHTNDLKTAIAKVGATDSEATGTTVENGNLKDTNITPAYVTPPAKQDKNPVLGGAIAIAGVIGLIGLVGYANSDNNKNANTTAKAQLSQMNKELTVPVSMHTHANNMANGMKVESLNQIQVPSDMSDPNKVNAYMQSITDSVRENTLAQMGVDIKEVESLNNCNLDEIN